MTHTNDRFSVTLAQTKAEIHAALSLRYQVFAAEMGVNGASVDHTQGVETDRFDDVAEHLILRDHDTGGQVVGTYRLIRNGPFSSDTEFDHARLKVSGLTLLELSRSCIRADYRDGAGMFKLWQALSGYIIDRKIDVLFGVASFWNSNTSEISDALSLLHHDHLAGKEIRSVSRTPVAYDLVDKASIDKRSALQKIPTLIKAYLRLGGKVGEGAYYDPAFNTIDVCMIVETAKINARQKAIYTR